MGLKKLEKYWHCSYYSIISSEYLQWQWAWSPSNYSWLLSTDDILYVSRPWSFFFKGNFKFPFLGGLFLGPYMRHMEVPRLGVEMELQLPAYTTVTAMPDPSHIYKLHQSTQQCWILNPLNGATDQMHVFMDSSQVLYHWATMGTPSYSHFIFGFLASFYPFTFF